MSQPGFPLLSLPQKHSTVSYGDILNTPTISRNCVPLYGSGSSDNSISHPGRHGTGSSMSPDNSLFSSTSVSLYSNGSSASSSGLSPEIHQTHAYNQLVRQYQQCQDELEKVKHEYGRLKTTHEDLVRTHMRLVVTFTDTQTVKKQRGDDDESAMDSSRLFSSAKPPSLSQVDYPLVKYWEKKVWKSVTGNRKDTSEIQTKSGSRGGTRSSKGENVMMLYIEDADGTPIDGNIAGGIRELARSIWRSLYERGIAPETWGQATKEVREEYCREMENEYHVLRLCDNHWKANAVATAIYSQWYRTYDRRVKPHPDNDSSEGDDGDGDDSDDDRGDGSDGPPRKKARTITEVDDANHSTESSLSNSDVQHMEEPSSSRHGTALKDPLSNVFAQPMSRFHVHETVPEVVQQTESNTDQRDTNRVASEAAVKTTNQATDAPNVDSTVLVPGVLNIALPPTTSGLPSTSTLMSAEVPHVSDPTPTPPPASTSTTLDPTAPVASSTTSPADIDPAMNLLRQKRYLHKKKMTPGISVTARNYCATDWCSINPEGTVGDFNRYWDEVKMDKERMDKYKKQEKEGQAAVRKKTPPRRAGKSAAPK